MGKYSLTAIGAIVWAAIQAAETTGVLPAGTADSGGTVLSQGVALAQTLSQLAVLLGIRNAIKPMSGIVTR
jgi:hypothetical protein